MLKGQDIALVFKILFKGKEEKIEYKQLAYELCISQSEISKSVIRLKKAKLMSRYENNIYEIHKHNLMEMLLHGLKYFLVPELNIEQRGVPTAYSSPYVERELTNKDSYVWPYIDGLSKGIALTPLYKTLPAALDRFPDERFYEVMSILDLIRLGGSREQKIGSSMLDKIIWK